MFNTVQFILNMINSNTQSITRGRQFFYHGATAPSGSRPSHYRGFMITHSDAPQSVGLLWTSDQPVAETSTWQHTTLTTDRHPCPRRDSNPQSQHASGRRPTPLGSAGSWLAGKKKKKIPRAVWNPKARYGGPRVQQPLPRHATFSHVISFICLYFNKNFSRIYMRTWSG